MPEIDLQDFQQEMLEDSDNFNLEWNRCEDESFSEEFQQHAAECPGCSICFDAEFLRLMCDENQEC